MSSLLTIKQSNNPPQSCLKVKSTQSAQATAPGKIPVD